MKHISSLIKLHFQQDLEKHEAILKTMKEYPAGKERDLAIARVEGIIAKLEEILATLK